MGSRWEDFRTSVLLDFSFKISLFLLKSLKSSSVIFVFQTPFSHLNYSSPWAIVSCTKSGNRNSSLTPESFHGVGGGVVQKEKGRERADGGEGGEEAGGGSGSRSPPPRARGDVDLGAGWGSPRPPGFGQCSADLVTIRGEHGFHPGPGLRSRGRPRLSPGVTFCRGISLGA